MRPVLTAASVAMTLAMGARQSEGQGITRVRCDSAAMTVAGHALPRAGAAEWSNWVALTGCGSRGAAVLAGALQSHAVRAEKDVARIDVLTGLLDGWYAPQLITTYESVAAASEATQALRLRAMWLLSGLFEPSVDVAGPLQAYTVRSCSAYGRTTSLRDAPSSLPPGASDGVRDALAIVAADKSSPSAVRSTAECWTGVLGGQVVAEEQERQNEPAASRYDSTWVCSWCANARPPSAIMGMPDWSYGSVMMLNQSAYQYSAYPYGYDASPYYYSPASIYPNGYYPYGGLVVSGPMRPLVPTSGLLGPPGVHHIGVGVTHPLAPPPRPPTRPRP
jgi:hypothetical protein